MRTPDELRKYAHAAIAALQLPPSWKLQGTDTVRVDSSDPDSEIICIGAVYTDTATMNMNLKRYRIFYNTHSEHLGIVEKSIIDFGKFAYNCLTSNKTIKQMNEFIAEYTNPPTPDDDDD